MAFDDLGSRALQRLGRRQDLGPSPTAQISQGQSLGDREFADSLLEGGVRCELVSKGSFIVLMNS
jgi:hypothetical protein